MKKKIFNKATMLFLAIMMVVTTFNFSIVASDYVDETVDMSVLDVDVVDESLGTEECALLEESPIPVEELIMIADAGTGTDEDPDVTDNDLNHIFGNPGHNLGGFLQSYGGNQLNAYNAVWSSAQSYVTGNNITGIINDLNQITINVSGFNITFRGNVINGKLRIGTFFIIG